MRLDGSCQRERVDTTRDRGCDKCAKKAPITDTDYTLIKRFKWRVTRKQNPDGTYEVRLLCPECWAAFKAASNPPPKG